MIPAPAGGSRRLGLALVAIAQLVVFGSLYSGFLSRSNLTAIGLSSTDVLIASIGAAALLISGNVDLSIGSQYALTAVVAAQVAAHTQAWIAVLAALGAGLLLGTVNGLLVVGLSISPLIVTLAMLALYRGLAFLLCSGNPVLVSNQDFVQIGQSHVLGLPTPVIIGLLVFLAGGWVLVTTVTGLRIYAVGGNPVAAALVGLPVKRIVVGTYAANGVIMGLVGLLVSAKLGSGSPAVGVNFEVSVLTAVILGGVAFSGGTGNPIGVLVGVLTLGVLEAGLIFAGLADWWQDISRGALLILALVADQVLLRITARRGGQPEEVVDTSAPVLVPRPAEPLLSVEGLSVRYGGVEALQGVDVTVHGGQVVCLLGDNGAGKSTLVKAITGAIRPSSGTLSLGGVPLPSTPAGVRKAGLETVFQDLALFQNLSVADNVTMGLEPRRRLLGVLRVRDHRAARATATERLRALGSPVGAARRVDQLSGGQRQAVAIARAVREDVRLIVLDEPTAALGARQSEEVLQLVRSAAQAGRGVLLVTHDLEDVFDVGDEAVVLGHGAVIARGPVAGMDRLELLRKMSRR